MQFKILSAITTVLAAQQAAAFSSKDVVNALDEITDLSADANDVVKDIGNGNFITVVPKGIDALKDIVTTVTKTISSLADPPTDAFKESEQTDICDALGDFVEVHKNLLDTLIGKEGVLSKTPFTAPIGAVLRVIEGGVDSLAGTIINLVPSCEGKANKDLDSLDSKLDEAVEAFSFKLPGLGK